MADELPVHFFATSEEWETWLQMHHAEAKGVWLKFAKKGTGVVSLHYPEALEVALCFGWIDGQVKGGQDEGFYRQRFTPRGPRSGWSQVNRDHVARLEQAGRMRPAGCREVERAKADGRWDRAYSSPSRAKVPDDLSAALNQDPQAKAFFESLSSQNRYAILYQLETAKKPETREARLQKYLAMLKSGRTVH